MIEIFSGKTGTGKSLCLAKKTFELVSRNQSWYKKTNEKRLIYSNLRFSPAFEHLYSDWFQYWKDPSELILRDNVDVLWDEIATNLDATQWEKVSPEVKIYLRQHRKRGIDIYGTTQRFGDIYNGVRYLTDRLWVCNKVIGSPSPAPTKPRVTYFWGLIWLNSVDPLSFDKEVTEQKMLGWDWFFIRKKYVSIYDTLQRIEIGEMPFFRHDVRSCPTCGFAKIYHA